MFVFHFSNIRRSHSSAIVTYLCHMDGGRASLGVSSGVFLSLGVSLSLSLGISLGLSLGVSLGLTLGLKDHSVSCKFLTTTRRDGRRLPDLVVFLALIPLSSLDMISMTEGTPDGDVCW